MATMPITEASDAMLRAPHQCSCPVPCMYWRRTYDGLAEQAHAAREFVRLMLADLPYVDDIVQAGAELIANALTHTRSGASGGFFTVELRRRHGEVALAVIDQGGPTDPVAHALDDNKMAETGRGLATVQALSSWWAWRGDRRGRSVTAVFLAQQP